MRQKFRWDKKYLHWGVTAFSVIAASVLFYILLTRLPAIGRFLKSVGNILGPFIWGFVICYLLAPLMKWMERTLFLPLGRRLFPKKEKGAAAFARGLSVTFSILIFLVVFGAVIYLIVSQLADALTIVQQAPDFIESLTVWAENLLADNPIVEEYATALLGNTNEYIANWVRTTVAPRLGDVVTSVTSGVKVFLVGVYNLIVGIFVSVYLLANLEGFKAGVKRLTYSIFSVETAEKLREAVHFTDKTFLGFISGKLLDSAIIGLICYIACLIMKMPYPLLVSVIVGVTNVIPFFGPFIGAIPCALIILMDDPSKFLLFVIFIILLQQLDGNVIGPKILGGSTGINGFWVMFSIIVGAGAFGFWGMLLGVPVFVVVYTFINRGTEKRLRFNDLPTDPEEYRKIEHIDPVTREITWAEPEPEKKPRTPKKAPPAKE
ncbi:MAG: AI-2E family transporter [Oscillospiraceae bacterium]|nr:AI-2E family transporter [Oscillospiraceae bacterium]